MKTFQVGEILRLRNPALAGSAHADVEVNYRGRIDSAHSVVSPVEPGMDLAVNTAHLSKGGEA